MARGTVRSVLRWVGPPVSAAALVVACLLIHWYAGIADTVEWDCAVSTCGTNDLRSFAPLLCGALMLLAIAGVAGVPGSAWWVGALLLVFALVAAWSIDWWRMPGMDAELFAAPIIAGVVGVAAVAVGARQAVQCSSG